MVKEKLLVISGKSDYVHRLFAHLKKEHPSVREHIYIWNDRRKKK